MFLVKYLKTLLTLLILSESEVSAELLQLVKYALASDSLSSFFLVWRAIAFSSNLIQGNSLDINPYYLAGIHHRFHCPDGKNYSVDLQIDRLSHPCMCICSNHLPHFLIDSTNNYKKKLQNYKTKIFYIYALDRKIDEYEIWICYLILLWQKKLHFWIIQWCSCHRGTM